jgi:hypothetical protein
MIEQKPEAQVPSKKMKKYGSATGHHPVEHGSYEMPKKDFPLKNESSGTMNYLSKQDELLGKDASKIEKGSYKDNRYK